jgi:hypothetical protein
MVFLLINLVSLNKPYTYEKIGAMTGLNKNDGTLI